MECYKIKNLSFSYPNCETKALHNINLDIAKGEFITVCGQSGCGKTTLLRLLKPCIAPHGNADGVVLYNGKAIGDYSLAEAASEIGFVMQDPDSQLVTDTVWHELAFGLESLGFENSEIRTRVSEMASYFGIQGWFHKKVSELSGGQKQLLNLASVMAMQPSVLILDEPTSQLDPVAAQEFLRTLEKINRELGTTVILSEHRLEDAFAVSHKIIVMEKGTIIVQETPEKTGKLVDGHPMYDALPAPVRIGVAMDAQPCPVTVRDGRIWLESFAENNRIMPELIPDDVASVDTDPVIELRDVWFRYEKNLPDIVRGVSLKINRGEIFAVTGANGTGKTTALSLISGLNKPYRGKVLINGESLEKIKEPYKNLIGVLPQNPQMLFVKKTVYLDLAEMVSEQGFDEKEKEKIISETARLCCIESLLGNHPYDLSGGEQQRVALAKVLLQNPQIIILDEPTKGMDAFFKEIFADILKQLSSNGVTVVMVSHDIEFCSKHSHRCALMFDGEITSTGTPRRFFSGNCFYTTSANRMARTTLPNAVLAEDIILACGGHKKTVVPQHEKRVEVRTEKPVPENKSVNRKKISPLRLTSGLLLGVLFIINCILQITETGGFNKTLLQYMSIAELGGCLLCLLRGYKPESHTLKAQKPSRFTAISAILILITIPLTIWMGMTLFGDRKYYFISLLIILQVFIPFIATFEGKKPSARKIIIISVICALAVAGRSAFFMLPQFKPTLAIIILAGVCFGGEAGFLAGAIAAFVSNFFFGQGPWTPWQMFATGITGFLAGVIFERGFLPHTKAVLCIFGAIATVVLYGGISNASSLILWQTDITKEMIISTYALGLPFDILHAASTVFFLYFISEPVIDKLERVKIKYGFK